MFFPKCFKTFIRPPLKANAARNKEGWIQTEREIEILISAAVVTELRNR